MARILIVDDSPSQLMGIRRIVEKLGHDALTAEDGAAGVEAAKREIPDLILMDVVMPNLNGFQATRSTTAASGISPSSTSSCARARRPTSPSRSAKPNCRS